MFWNGLPYVLERIALCSGTDYPMFLNGLPYVLEPITLCSGTDYPIIWNGLPYVLEPITLCSGTDYPMFWNGLPYVLERITLCSGTDYPMFWRKAYVDFSENGSVHPTGRLRNLFSKEKKNLVKKKYSLEHRNYIMNKKSKNCLYFLREDTHKKSIFSGRTTKDLPSLHQWLSGTCH